MSALDNILADVAQTPQDKMRKVEAPCVNQLAAWQKTSQPRHQQVAHLCHLVRVHGHGQAKQGKKMFPRADKADRFGIEDKIVNAWIGGKWSDQGRRLILGESWWGPELSLHQYVLDWCEQKQDDALLDCLFNACSGHQIATATYEQRLDFWDRLAFMNFVYWSVGSTNTCKASSSHFLRAQPGLENFLKAIKPHSVWILGLNQAEYSQPIISRLGIKYVVTEYLRTGISAAQLWADYIKL
jgi:hypothetical protein